MLVALIWLKLKNQSLSLSIIICLEQLSDDEVDAAVTKAIDDSGADSMKDMGKLMGILKGPARWKSRHGCCFSTYQGSNCLKFSS